MTQPTYTTRTYDALVELARSIRPDWHVPGLRAVIREVLEWQEPPTLAQLAYAVVRCAENPTVLTPAVIAQREGQHWRRERRETEPTRAVTCRCGDTHMPSAPCRTDRPTTNAAEHLQAARTLLGIPPKPEETR